MKLKCKVSYDYLMLDKLPFICDWDMECLQRNVVCGEHT